MELKLEHIVGYLPFNLQVKYIGFDRVWLNHGQITTLLPSDIDRTIKEVEFKPLLLPLSSLTKEIEHNGEKFVPIDWLEDKYYTLSLHKECERLLEKDGYKWINHMSHLLILHLYEWKFDIHGLIEQGLAIDKSKI